MATTTTPTNSRVEQKIHELTEQKKLLAELNTNARKIKESIKLMEGELGRFLEDVPTNQYKAENGATIELTVKSKKEPTNENFYYRNLKRVFGGSHEQADDVLNKVYEGRESFEEVKFKYTAPNQKRSSKRYG